MSTNDYAYVTAITNDYYLPGLKALKKSLDKCKTKYNLVIIVPTENDTLYNNIKRRSLFNKNCILLLKESIEVTTSNAKQQNHYWHNTFFKIQAASLYSFKKIILIDSDMLVMKNIDHLFQKENYSCVIAGKISHPEYEDLNSGLIVLEPNVNLYNSLLRNIVPTIEQLNKKDILAGDQDVFINTLTNWRQCDALKMSERYNCFFADIYKVCRAEKCKIKDLYVIHFIGKNKPWSLNIFSIKFLHMFVFYFREKRFTQFFILLRYILLCR